MISLQKLYSTSSLEQTSTSLEGQGRFLSVRRFWWPKSEGRCALCKRRAILTRGEIWQRLLLLWRGYLVAGTLILAARSRTVGALIVRASIVARSASSIWVTGRCRVTSITASPQPKSNWHIHNSLSQAIMPGHSDRYDRKQPARTRVLRLLPR